VSGGVGRRIFGIDDVPYDIDSVVGLGAVVEKDGKLAGVNLGNGEVSPTVAVEVPDGDRNGFRARPKVARWLERFVAVAEQDRDKGMPVRCHKVEDPVAVEGANREGRGPAEL